MSESATLIPHPALLPDAAIAELRGAVDALEKTSLAVRLATMLGAPLEALTSRLPGPAQSALNAGVRRALTTAMKAALRSDPSRVPVPGLSPHWFHRGVAAATGTVGGAFGLPGTLMELPFSTTLLLRRIASVAQQNGEPMDDPMVAAECLKVFALGGRDPSDDAAESGYFAVRIALAEALKGALGRGLLLPGFVGAIAGRFGGPMALKLSAQAAPLVGAAAGAAVNLTFLEHFSGIAQGHFTVRRLEREHGVEPVRAAYEAIRAGRDARFIA